MKAGSGQQSQGKSQAVASLLTTVLPTQVLLQTGDPGTGGWPATRLQVRQELQRLEGGRGHRESELTVRTGPRTWLRHKLELKPFWKDRQAGRPPHCGCVPCVAVERRNPAGVMYPERLWPLLAHLLELQASGFEVTCLLTLQPGLQLLPVPALTAEETLPADAWGRPRRRVQGEGTGSCSPAFLPGLTSSSQPSTQAPQAGVRASLIYVL